MTAAQNSVRKSATHFPSYNKYKFKEDYFVKSGCSITYLPIPIFMLHGIYARGRSASAVMSHTWSTIHLSLLFFEFP